MKFKPDKMDSDSLGADVTQSLLRMVLTRFIPSSCPGTLSNPSTMKDDPDKLSTGNNCQTTAGENRIHILVSDQAGRTLFDSDRYIQRLHVHVYDDDGYLLYSSSEHFWNKNKQSEKPLKMIKQNTRNTKMGKRKKPKNKHTINDNECNKRNSDLPLVESNITIKPVINHILHVEALEKFEELKNHTMDIDSDNNVKVVNVSTGSLTETHIEDALPNSVYTEANISSQKPVSGSKRKAKSLATADTKSETDFTGPAESATCGICGIKYKSVVMLNRHKQVHEVEHTDMENPLQCPICRKVYPSWRSLTIHKRKHGAAKDNVCEKCGTGFRTKQELIRHEFVHSSAKSSPCHICGKLFKNKAYAQMHSKLHSAENRKHICKLCGKNFLRGPDIQKHMRIHTGEKPFICSQCGRSFSESSHLLRHERLHTGEKPYKCERCDLRFTHKEVLIRHSFTHMDHLPFSCEVCNKGFKTKRELDHHWLIHDKPTDQSVKEACKVCGKVFSHALYLRYHMRTHNNLGRFECPVCAKVFKKPSYLRQHTITQHAYSAQALEPEFEMSTVNPEQVGLSVKEIVGPINSNSAGIFGGLYADVSCEISHLLFEQDSNQVG